MAHKFVTTETVVARELGDELILLDLAGGTYFGLDAIGAQVWKMLSEGKPLADIITALDAEYDVQREVLAADIVELLDDLCSKGLVCRADDPL